jgi:hypothetical protein
VLEGLAITVVGGLILAGVIGAIRLVRGGFGSPVRFIAKVTDFGDPTPGFITWRVGLVLDVEVHVLGPEPMRITEVGLELRDGTRIELATASNLNAPIAAPDYVEASNYMTSVRKDVASAGSPVRGFYATATPDRMFRQGFPKSWKGFPDAIPVQNR